MNSKTDKQAADAIGTERRRRYLRRALYFVIALSIILITLPYIIRYQLIDELELAGAESVQIDDLDYNPFTAVMSINNLLIKNNQEVTLRVSYIQLDVDWFPVLRQRLSINTATLHDADLLIEHNDKGELKIAGYTITNGDEDEEEEFLWHAGIESLTLENTDIRIRANKQDHKLQINNASLEKLHTWESDNKAKLALEGNLNNSPLNLDILLALFGDALEVSGLMQVDKLELHPIMPELVGQLTVTGNMIVRLDKKERLSITHDGDFILTRAKYTLPDLLFNADDITITGQNSLALNTGSSDNLQIELTQSGTLAINQAQFTQPVQKIELLRFNKLNANSIQMKSLNQVELGGIEITSASLLRDTKSEDANPMASSELVSVDQLRLDNTNTLALGNIVFNTLQLAIERNKQGELVPLSQALSNHTVDNPQTDTPPTSVKPAPVDADQRTDTPPSKNDTSESVEQPDDSTDDAVRDDDDIPSTTTDRPATVQQDELTQTDSTVQVKNHPGGFNLKLDSVKVTGNSYVKVDDNRIQPGYHSQLQIKQAEVGRLDSKQPKNSTPIQIELLPTKFGSVKITGDIHPFTPDYDFKIDLIAKAISLPRLSPYLSHYIGYQFKQGQMDTDSKISAVDDQLNGQLNVVIKQLELTPDKSEKAEQMRKQLGMPVNEALSMLRDADNNIKLEIPVTGNLSSPDFSLNNIISLAIANAIKTGASSYLLYALGPYGIALALADKTLSSGSLVQLSNIDYQPGQTDIPENTRDYLTRLQKITEERPEVELHLCANATELDRKAIRDTSDDQNINPGQQTAKLPDDAAVLAVARQRMTKLKGTLIEEYSISSGRVFLCKPAVDQDKQAIPHINVTL